MTNICFETIVFNTDYVLAECIKSLLPYGKVIVAEGPVKFWQDRGFTTSTDKTNSILAELLPKEDVIHSQWDEKDAESNAPLHLVPDNTDFLWLVDSDEIWAARDIERIIGILETGEWDSAGFKPYSFFGGLSRYMTGFEEQEWHRIQRWYPGARWYSHRPPTILAPDGRPWRNHRHLSYLETDKMGIRFAHYTYVWLSQMQAKAKYYEAYSPGVTIPDYMNRVWLPWVLGNDITRQVIEREFDGVHNWRPERRGACFTATFAGEHPQEIQKVLPELKQRFNKEIKQYANAA